jgi:hypothetical protein
MQQSILIFILFMFVTTSSSAGTLINGAWSPSGCGEKPEPPIVDSSSAEEFNRSIDAINEWQDRSLEYNSCLINEANADSALIVNTANDVQTRLKEEIDRVITEADQVRLNLNGK